MKRRRTSQVYEQRIKAGREVQYDQQDLSGHNLNKFQLKEQFQRLQRLRTVEEAREIIKNLYGRHNPMLYKAEFNFQQNWETTGAHSEADGKYASWKNQSMLVNVMQSVLILCYAVSVWFLPIYRIFQVTAIDQFFISAVLVITAVDIAIEEANNSQINKTIKEKMKNHAISLSFLLYLCAVITEAEVIGYHSEYFVPVDFFFAIKLYYRLKSLCVMMKIRIPSGWRNEIQISQLVAGCLILIHIFSIILFLMAQTDTKNNWTLSVSEFNDSWAYRYLFSLYFACTSMFTAGYGDITPQNPAEILTILVVQVVGILNMGYVINEVGRCLSKMNEGEQQLYRGISDAQKFSKNYSLPQDLSQKMTSDVINNQIAKNTFNIDEEDHFISRLGDQVRQQVTRYNKFQIIKTSVFFLCHWTKHFQNTIADKLIRQVYSPDETLAQIQGKQKLYILGKGKIDIIANFRQRPYSRKRLVTIQIDPKKDVHFKVYGYSSLISGHKVNLCAVARDYSICYYVDKQILKNAIYQHSADFEYFHSIRSKVDESKCKESFEAPIIKSTKEHYIPNVYFIIKRAQKSIKRTHKRKFYKRSNLKQKFVVDQQKQLSRQNSFQDIRNQITIALTSLSIDIIADNNRRASIEPITSLQSFREQELKMEAERKEKLICNDLEKLKNYAYFMKNFNSENVIAKYSKLFGFAYKEKDLTISSIYGKGMKVDKKTLQKLFSQSKVQNRT